MDDETLDASQLTLGELTEVLDEVFQKLGVKITRDRWRSSLNVTFETTPTGQVL